MGWRISLYCVPKKTVEKYKDVTQEEYDKKWEEINDEFEKDQIKYDTLTDIIGFCSKEDENKFSTKLFTNHLEIESDMYFGTVSKEQFLNIIEEVRENHIVKWFWDRRVEKRKDETILGDAWSDERTLFYYGIYDGKVDPEFAMSKNQNEWNHKGRFWKSVWNDDGHKSYPNINLDMNNKWMVSNGWTYEYLIFDLIHILKIFDWENDIIVAIGG